MELVGVSYDGFVGLGETRRLASSPRKSTNEYGLIQRKSKKFFKFPHKFASPNTYSKQSLIKQAEQRGLIHEGAVV